jgi:hypothetical protein
MIADLGRDHRQVGRKADRHGQPEDGAPAVKFGLRRRNKVSYPFGGIAEPVTYDDANCEGLVVPFRLLTLGSGCEAPESALGVDDLAGDGRGIR